MTDEEAAAKHAEDRIVRGMTMEEIRSGKAPKWIAEKGNPQPVETKEVDVPSTSQDS